jgi:hypothetical protein
MGCVQTPNAAEAGNLSRRVGECQFAEQRSRELDGITGTAGKRSAPWGGLHAKHDRS